MAERTREETVYMLHQAITDNNVDLFRNLVDADPQAVNVRHNYEHGMDSVPATALECLLSLWYYLWDSDRDHDSVMSEEQIAAYREMISILMAKPETNIHTIDPEGDFVGVTWLIRGYMEYVDEETKEEVTKIRSAQFAAFSAFVIRCYNKRTDYDPNELRPCYGVSFPDWISLAQMVDMNGEIDDTTCTQKVEFTATILDAILEHPDIHVFRIYPAVALYPDPLQRAFTVPGLDAIRVPMRPFLEKHFGDRLRRDRAKRLWSKVRLWRLVMWWWTTACEGQYAPGGAGCIRENRLYCETMRAFCMPK